MGRTWFPEESSSLMYSYSLLSLQLQRPGIEDVTVLKKELIQVQTLMDKTTLEREKESEKLKDDCKQLQMHNSNAKVILKEQMNTLGKKMFTL